MNKVYTSKKCQTCKLIMNKDYLQCPYCNGTELKIEKYNQYGEMIE